MNTTTKKKTTIRTNAPPDVVADERRCAGPNIVREVLSRASSNLQTATDRLDLLELALRARLAMDGGAELFCLPVDDVRDVIKAVREKIEACLDEIPRVGTSAES